MGMASVRGTKRLSWLTVGASIATLAIVVASLAIILDDPEVPIEARVVEGITSSDAVAIPSLATVSQSVDGLERLKGVLRPSSEADEWTLSGLEIDVGPESWMRATIVETDIDGDGQLESIYDEMRGVSGEEVEIWVRFDNTRDDAELFAIQQTFLRDPTAAQPPWEGSRHDD